MKALLPPNITLQVMVCHGILGDRLMCPVVIVLNHSRQVNEEMTHKFNLVLFIRKMAPDSVGELSVYFPDMAIIALDGQS